MDDGRLDRTVAKNDFLCGLDSLGNGEELGDVVMVPAAFNAVSAVAAILGSLLARYCLPEIAPGIVE